MRPEDFEPIARIMQDLWSAATWNEELLRTWREAWANLDADDVLWALRKLRTTDARSTRNPNLCNVKMMALGRRRDTGTSDYDSLEAWQQRVWACRNVHKWTEGRSDEYVHSVMEKADRDYQQRLSTARLKLAASTEPATADRAEGT